MAFLEESLQTLDTQESESDEALSLCDLPLKGEDVAAIQRSRSSPADEDPFEFSNGDRNCQMCAAEDVFFSGKILPFRYRVPIAKEPDPKSLREKKFLHLRSSSLNGLGESRTGSKGCRLTRSSYSLDYQKLERTESPKGIVSEEKCFGRHELRRVSSGTKPRWYSLGLMKAPAEMEIGDIRNRQRRRYQSGTLPVSGSGEAVSGKSTWTVLRALSCKGSEAIAIR